MTEVKRALSSNGFYIGAIGSALIIIVSAGLKIYYMSSTAEGAFYINQGFHIELLIEAMHSQLYLMFVPILSALPYTASYIEDRQCGMQKMYLIRCSKAIYSKQKVLATSFAGGSVILVGVAASYSTIWLLTSPMQIVADNMSYATVQLMPNCIAYFLSGAIWSTVGGFISLRAKNKYMAYLSPFIVHYLLVIFNERYIKTAYIINPYEWLNPQQYWPGGEWGLVLVQFEVLLVISMMYYVGIYKNINED